MIKQAYNKRSRSVPQAATRKRKRAHKCEVTLDRLFQEIGLLSEAVQEQIDALSAAITPTVTLAPTAPATGIATRLSSMPTDHPLHTFIQESTVQTDWNARAHCGQVNRRYDDWWAKQEANNANNHVRLNHLRLVTLQGNYADRRCVSG